MNYWLVKTEPSTFSIQDLKQKKSTLWDGVRNYQARNYLKNMKLGDWVLIYHSNASPSGVVGCTKIIAEAVPDPTQFDSKSDYYDSRSSISNPIWFCPQLSFVKQFRSIIALDTLKGIPELHNLPLVKKGCRLSVMPVSQSEYELIIGLAG